MLARILLTTNFVTLTGIVVAASTAIIVAVLSVKRTVTTIEVNTNKRLSDALGKIDSLEGTITQLVQALAVAQVSPAISTPVVVPVVIPEVKP